MLASHYQNNSKRQTAFDKNPCKDEFGFDKSIDSSKLSNRLWAR
jgi:hypothetical protein